MDIKQLIPFLGDLELDIDFKNHEQFVLDLFFWIKKNNKDYDERKAVAVLSVLMAYRDHYPKYLSKLSKDEKTELNRVISSSSPKIIKLRRIALASLAKVA